MAIVWWTDFCVSVIISRISLCFLMKTFNSGQIFLCVPESESYVCACLSALVWHDLTRIAADRCQVTQNEMEGVGVVL